MAVKRITCRAHGGVFVIQHTRGRTPVRCKPDNPCDQNPGAHATKQPQTFAEEAVRRKGVAPAVRTPAESNGNGQTLANPSLPLAMAAKSHLEAVGWAVKGRAWIAHPEANPTPYAELTASRGDETLVMLWGNSKLLTQDYSLNYERPVDNGFPPNKLDFNPEELTDRELVERIKGMKVTWWNTLASSPESGVIGNKVNIEHVFDDDSAKRLVKFIDHGGGGFRAFHVAALLKVG